MNALEKIERYFDDHRVPFDLVAHTHSETSLETARSAGVDAHRLAKGVLLESDDCYMVAMVPASDEVMLGKLRSDYGREFHLADANAIRAMFSDCEAGVVPGMPAAWGVEMVWDDALLTQPDVYLEAGDHSRLIHLETRYLRDLIGESPQCRIGQPSRKH